MPTIEITDALYDRIRGCFAKRVQELRHESGLTQPDFGKRFGVGQSSVSRWEIGFCLPRLKKLCLIAVREEVSVDWLLGFSSERQPALPAPVPLRVAR